MINTPAHKPKHAIVLLLIAGCGFFAAAVMAGEWNRDKEHSLLPAIPAAQADQCVEPTEIMRRRHMDFILHQRDETVHKGVRTEKHRFVNCINCHIQPQRMASAQLAYPRHTDAEHFCTSCHVYSLVSIDCFQCHADRPERFYQQRRQAVTLSSAAAPTELLPLLLEQAAATVP